MISRFIFVTGLVLLCFSIVSGIFLLRLLLSSQPAFEMIPLPHPWRYCQCAGGPSPTISERDLSWLAIVGELPKQMESSTSDMVELKLTLRDGLDLPYPSSNNVRTILHPDISHVLDDDVENYCALQPTSDQPTSKCSTSGGKLFGPPVGSLFGPGYELFASAHLVATGFDVQLLDATEQPADQFIIEWDWNIFAKSAGNQPINLNVDLHWKPVGNNGKEDVFRQIWESNPTITVNPPPFFAPGQLTISTIISASFALIFTGVSGPTILGELKKRREAKPQERLEQELKQIQVERDRLRQELEQEQAERERLEQKLSRREQLKRKQLNWELSRRERFRRF